MVEAFTGQFSQLQPVHYSHLKELNLVVKPIYADDFQTVLSHIADCKELELWKIGSTSLPHYPWCSKVSWKKKTKLRLWESRSTILVSFPNCFRVVPKSRISQSFVPPLPNILSISYVNVIGLPFCQVSDPISQKDVSRVLRRFPSLQTLQICKVHKFGEESPAATATTLASALPSLQKVVLKHCNSTFSDRGVPKLRELGINDVIRDSMERLRFACLVTKHV